MKVNKVVLSNMYICVKLKDALWSQLDYQISTTAFQQREAITKEGLAAEQTKFLLCSHILSFE